MAVSFYLVVAAVAYHFCFVCATSSFAIATAVGGHSMKFATLFAALGLPNVHFVAVLLLLMTKMSAGSGDHSQRARNNCNYTVGPNGLESFANTSAMSNID